MKRRKLQKNNSTGISGLQLCTDRSGDGGRYYEKYVVLIQKDKKRYYGGAFWIHKYPSKVIAYIEAVCACIALRNRLERINA